MTAFHQLDRWIEAVQILAQDQDNPTADRRTELAETRRRMLSAYRAEVLREAASLGRELSRQGYSAQEIANRLDRMASNPEETK